LAGPESLQILLAAARWAMQAENGQALNQAAARVKDWDAVIELASQNTVIPLIARALRDSESVPLPVRRELYRRYFEYSSRNAFLAAELHDILNEFHRAGIEALAYKGPALAAMAYGDLALRHPSGDIDLLLRRPDIDRAKNLIQTRGYRLLAPDSEQHFLKHRYHLHYERRDPEIHVELHWAFTPVYWPFPIDQDHLWGRARRVTLSGSQVRTLNAECAVLALCAHGAKEGWPRLSQILDLGRLIQSHPDLDWHWVLAEARRMRRERVLRLGLWLVTELAGARIPEPAESEIRNDEEVPQLGTQIKNNFLTGRFCGSDFHRYALRVWHHASDRRRYLGYLCRLLPAKIHAIVRPSGRDRDFLDLGQLPPFLYAFVRPLRVMHQYRDPRLVVRKLMRNL
jgi:Uncharacterised nucleotidyltransferase